MVEDRAGQARRAAILRHIGARGRARVSELAELLGATPQTIRRDLALLAEAGEVTRFHGGAALLAGVESLAFERRLQIATPEKQAIARAAARLVPERSTLFINAGTTTTFLARELAHHLRLTVIADSVFLANELRAAAAIELVVPPGRVRASDGAILGADAVAFLRRFRPDLAVIGAAAIAADGALLDFDLQEAAMVRAMVEQARRVILCADSAKFGRAAPVEVARLGDVQTLVTDEGCPEALVELCRAEGVEVIRARR
ncbi:MAG: DeoR/GlpR transcriptional regulator [Alphaproteobacteria bacterium]|nr:MAG: DeoR/GlpR transcriptional regulator [Alphaproteobacteria bacterium]